MLEQIGFQAVINGLGTFISGTGQIQRAQAGVETSTKKSADAFGAFQKIALASAAAGVAAVAGLGIATLKMAADFDKGMREVNSIAKLSEGGFKQLEKDVLAFSKEMGIAANEVVPALYQALSAGITADNVIEFMRVASKAAIGGVTTLETAVDGLTSVVNAYGAETLPASRAADIMFKGVELGKSTFDELAVSLSDVVPTAVAAGVSFEEVSAAIATMTVRGTRTTVATSNLNQALVELQKPMPPLAAVMEKAAKKIGAADGSFKSLKATGASLQEILVALDDSAAEMGLSMTQVFGSVEAGKAVLQLTGNNAAGAAADLDKVTNSAGSADAAFKELNKSAARQYEMLKTKITSTMIELGTRALPLVIRGLEQLNALFVPAVAGGAKLAAALASVAKFASDNKVQVGLFIGILAVPKILGAASALLQVAGAMRGIAAAKIAQVGSDYAFFAKNLAGAPGLTRTLGPLVMTLGSLAGPLALGGIALAAVGASLGLEKFIPFLHKGESAADQFKKSLQDLKDRLSDIDRALAIGRIDVYTAAEYRVANVMATVIRLGDNYVKMLDDLEGAKGLISAADRAKMADKASADLAKSMAEVLRNANLTEPEIAALTNGMAEMGSQTLAGNDAYLGLLRALDLVYPATAAQAGITKEAAAQAKASLTPLQQQAKQFEDIAARASAATTAIKGYDDTTKAVAGALTKEQLAADAEIATLKRRKQELILSGRAAGDEATAIDARIQRLEDERTLADLTIAELVAKGRAEEFLAKVRDGSIKTDRDKLVAVLDLLEATGQDVSKEREFYGILPTVTKAVGDQTTALEGAAQAAGKVGPAALTSAGQVEGAAGRMTQAIKGPQQEEQELLDFLRETGPTALAQGSLFSRFAAMANAALDSIRIAQLVGAIEAANRALAGLGLQIPVPTVPTVEGRDFGGPVAAGRPMIVGETQAEVWIPRSPGVVARPQQLQLGGSGLGGTTFSPQFNFNGPDRDQARAMFHRFVEDFFRRSSAGAVGAGASIYSGTG